MLKVERIPVAIRENRLGIYDVEGLRVWLEYRAEIAYKRLSDFLARLGFLPEGDVP